MLIDIHPDGHSYLTTPHDGTVLRTHRFPDNTPLAFCDASRVFGDDWFAFVAGYIDGATLIAKSVETSRHYVFDVRTLDPLGEIIYPHDDTAADSIIAAGDGTWLTLSPSGSTTRWSIADSR